MTPLGGALAVTKGLVGQEGGLVGNSPALCMAKKLTTSDAGLRSWQNSRLRTI